MQKIHIVRLVFQIQIGVSGKNSFEEQLRCYNAGSAVEAFRAACNDALKEEITLPQDDHGFVSWKFLGIADIIEANITGNGCLVDSKTIEPGHDPDYEPYIRQKIMRLENSMQLQIPAHTGVK